MSTTTNQEPVTADAVRADLLTFLEQRTKQAVDPDLDLFASGLVSSMFAMELVVHLESAFGLTIGGPDLKLDHFRTVTAMTALVLRLRETADG